jgi:hypothetical protein
MNKTKNAGHKIPSNLLNIIFEMSYRINEEPIWILHTRYNKLHFVLNQNCDLYKKISKNIEKKMITGKYVSISKYELISFCNGSPTYSVKNILLNEEI